MATIKIFRIGDCDWVAASTKKEAVEVVAGLYGDSVEEVSTLDCVELGEAELNRLKIVDLDDDDAPNQTTSRTFKEELQRQIDRGESFPQFFATSEF